MAFIPAISADDLLNPPVFKQIRFPRSRKRRLLKKWSANCANWAWCLPGSHLEGRQISDRPNDSYYRGRQNERFKAAVRRGRKARAAGHGPERCPFNRASQWVLRNAWLAGYAEVGS